MPSLQLLKLTRHGQSFLASRRKAIPLASGILIAGGTAAYILLLLLIIRRRRTHVCCTANCFEQQAS